jgi:ubiquinone/menaquinone biosynthesis C-methylase UbiE
MPTIQTALLPGEGNGYFLAALLSAEPEIRVDVVDICKEMVGIAEQRVTHMGQNFCSRAEFHCADIREFVPGTTRYDLIATHFFLDCFSTSEVHEIVSRIADWAAPRAFWVVSEFHKPENGVYRAWSSALIRSLYLAFRITTGLETSRLPDYRPALSSAGFELRCEQQACGGVLVSELWQRGS